MKAEKPKQTALILASQSPYKAELLRKLTTDFYCESPNIDESPTKSESPYALARRLAHEKATAVAREHPNKWVLGCDQVAVLSNDKSTRILGKPGRHEVALEQLMACSGERVEFRTSCCLVHVNKAVSEQITDSFFVQFRVLERSQIERYLLIEKPYDCAGSIKSEGRGIALIKQLDGNDPNTLIGLPLIKLVDAFHKHDIDCL